ncbi:peptidase S8 [Halobacillus andaensis]|uniref:Peptidase S8 n=1 Tax=Halobacillus andaensis TaxID=1176239 RepID=A0A917B7L6_HALAA|nr:S8 family serine peptidase [Halobacillus andaensis]MBP2005683.1 subtilisin family serine protease [Halobacillus andaensis]GGF26788.1 peptidase S8 [Halobacillus andaensis]
MKKIFLYGLMALLFISSFNLNMTNSAAEVTENESPLFMVVFNSENLPKNAEDIVESAGGEVTYQVPKAGVIEATSDTPGKFMNALMKHKDVQSVSPSLEEQLDLPEFDIVDREFATSLEANPVENIWEDGWQWDIEQVTNDGASHDLDREAREDVVVAVIDSGFDFNHPDLAGHVDEEGSRTFVPDTTNSWDYNSHGTHVAGTIGAEGRMKGVAPGVTLRSYRVFGASGGASQIWITDAIIAAADDGADVINMSLGGTRLRGQWFYTDPATGERISGGNSAADIVAYNRAIRYAIDKGVTVVSSAGNSAQDISNPSKVGDWQNSSRTDGWEAKGAVVFVPAQIPGVVTVSATGGGFGTEDRLAFYSNYGNGAINLGAPGGDLGPEDGESASKYLVLSTVPTYMDFTAGRGPEAKALFGQGYGWKGGTSMAAPQVSGAAAAYIAQQYEETGSKPNPRQVQTHLQQTAVDTGKTGYDEYYGHGIVNAYNALTR